MLKRLRHLVPLALLGLALYFLVRPPAALLDHLRLLAFDTFQATCRRDSISRRRCTLSISTTNPSAGSGNGRGRAIRSATLGGAPARTRRQRRDRDRCDSSPSPIAPRRCAHPGRIAGRARARPNSRRRSLALPDHDQEFAARDRQGSGRAPGRSPSPTVNDASGADALHDAVRRHRSAPVSAVRRRQGRGALPLPEPLEAAAAWASARASISIPMADGVERRVPLVFRQRDIAGAGARGRGAAGRHQRAQSIALKASDASGEALADMAAADRHCRGADRPAHDSDRCRRPAVAARHRPCRRARFIPVWQVMELARFRRRSRIDGADRLCIGTSAAGLADIRPTPLDAAAPGVEVHAQIAGADHSGRLYRPAGLDARRRVPVRAGLPADSAFRSSLVELDSARCWCRSPGAARDRRGADRGSRYSYAHFHFLTDPVLPSLTVLLVYLSSSGLRFLASERERRWVRSAFSQYLSPVLVEQLAASPERLALGGEMRELTLMFCDIRGFTTISGAARSARPDAIYQRLPHADDRYRARSSRHHRQIYRRLPDGVLERAARRRRACAPRLPGGAGDGGGAARGQPATRQPMPPRRGHEAPPIMVGIGLNSGPCSVGNMGSEQRFDYSVLGDTVNLASRLESQSKTYGVTIVIAEDTRTEAPELAALELDMIRVKGKTRPVRIFTLIGDAALGASAGFKLWQAAHDRVLALYRERRWSGGVARASPRRRPMPKAASRRSTNSMATAFRASRPNRHLANGTAFMSRPVIDRAGGAFQ